jgi:hypothetical protein
VITPVLDIYPRIDNFCLGRHPPAIRRQAAMEPPHNALCGEFREQPKTLVAKRIVITCERSLSIPLM